VTSVIGVARLERWVARPVFWWTAMALLAGGPLLSGLLRHPPAPLPVLDQVPATGRGRLVVFGDPTCPGCIASSSQALQSLSRHLRSVRQGFELEWVPLGEGGAAPALGPTVLMLDDEARAAPLIALLRRRAEQGELRRGERAVLIDPGGRIRALPLLSEPPGRDLLPAISQVLNGR
jgi:hypothetical protein